MKDREKKLIYWNLIIAISTTLLLVVFSFIGMFKEAGITGMAVSSQADGVIYYVDIQGIGGTCSDNNPGTISQPWCTAIKGFSSAEPGDTVYFREGIYRQNVTINSSLFPKTATAENRIYYKGYPGEKAIISYLQLKNDTNLWRNEFGEVYSINITYYRIIIVSQDDIPLKRMKHLNDGPGNAHDLTGPGQWIDEYYNTWKLYVWARGGGNPGNYKLEVTDPSTLNDEISTLAVLGSENLNERRTNYLSFENLIFEGGYWNMIIRSHNIEINNCTFRKSYAGGIAASNYTTGSSFSFSKNVIIENSDFYYFGNTGIDAFSAYNWTIRNNKIHDNVVTNPNDKASIGILLKNHNNATVVEKNQIYNINSKFGAIGLGGQSWGGLEDEGINLIVKNNIFYNITAPYGILFEACNNCSFYNNLVYGSNFSSVIIDMIFSNNNSLTLNKDCKIKNNIFYGNKAGSLNLLINADPNSIPNLELDYNVINGSLNYYLGNGTKNLSQIRKDGYETHSIANLPLFTDVANRDFHLQAGSPAIDAGICIPKVKDDFNGVSRPQGSSCDIGPYEYLQQLIEQTCESQGYTCVSGTCNGTIMNYNCTDTSKICCNQTSVTERNCEQRGHYCLAASNCSSSDRLNYNCNSGVCCSKLPTNNTIIIPQDKTCAELNGKICNASEFCNGTISWSKDSNECCLGNCEEGTANGTAEPNKNYWFYGVLGGIIIAIIGVVSYIIYEVNKRRGW